MADEWVYLGKIYPSPGVIDELLHIFLARSLHPTAQQLDDDEFIQLQWVPLETLKERIAQGNVTDCKAISALLLADLQNRL